MNADRLTLREDEAAALLGLSRPTLHRLRRNGRLPFVRVGSRVLYRMRDLERFLDRNAQNDRGSGCDSKNPAARRDGS